MIDSNASHLCQPVLHDLNLISSSIHSISHSSEQSLDAGTVTDKNLHIADIFSTQMQRHYNYSKIESSASLSLVRVSTQTSHHEWGRIKIQSVTLQN